MPDHDHSLSRSTQQKTSRKRPGISGMEGQDVLSTQIPDVRKMMQLLGGVLDPAWTVMDMAHSMLLLLDHSFTVAFKDVAQFSAAVFIGMTFDSFEMILQVNLCLVLLIVGLKLLMLMSRKTKGVILSVHMVVAVKKNTGMRQYL